MFDADLVGKKRDGLGHHVGGTQDFDDTRVHVNIATERLNVDCGAPFLAG